MRGFCLFCCRDNRSLAQQSGWGASRRQSSLPFLLSFFGDFQGRLRELMQFSKQRELMQKVVAGHTSPDQRMRGIRYWLFYWIMNDGDAPATGSSSLDDISNSQNSACVATA